MNFYPFGSHDHARAHFVIGGMGDSAVGISYAGVDNSFYLFEIVLGAPKASSGKVYGKHLFIY